MEIAVDTNDYLRSQLTRAMQCSGLGDYAKAQEYLDQMLESNPDNYLLWYEKSKLPIVQEDSVTIKNRTISLFAYMGLTVTEKNDYLQWSGFGISELPEVESFLRVPNLVADQRIRFLKMAIACAPEKEQSEYKAELNAIIAHAKERKRKDIHAAILVGSIALVFAVLAVLSLNFIIGAWFSKRLLYMMMAIVIPYALSILGMSLYTKARNNGNPTAIGLVCNLLALIISNLAIINALVLFFMK